MQVPRKCLLCAFLVSSAAGDVNATITTITATTYTRTTTYSLHSAAVIYESNLSVDSDESTVSNDSETELYITTTVYSSSTTTTLASNREDKPVPENTTLNNVSIEEESQVFVVKTETSEESHDGSPAVLGAVFGTLGGLCCLVGSCTAAAFWFTRRRQGKIRTDFPSQYAAKGDDLFDLQGHVPDSYPDNAVQNQEEPEVLGPYQILRVLGRGSFGVVLLGDDGKRQVAIKLIPCDHLHKESAEQARAEAEAEAELMQKLRHPNVVCCNDVCWDSERQMVWFSLDYMNGGDLQCLIERRRVAGEGAPDVEFVREVIQAISSALHYIHSLNILHRDVKPSNILLDSGMQDIKLGDFGVSKILASAGKLATTVIGTPSYLSPELVKGQPYGPEADAWALGVCAYELFALRRPFDAENPLWLAKQVAEQEPKPLLNCPRDVSSAVYGLLEKEPTKRLQVMGAMVQITPRDGQVVKSVGYTLPSRQM